MVTINVIHAKFFTMRIICGGGLFCFFLEVTSQSSQPSSGLPYPAETDPPQLLPLSTQSCVDGAYISPCVTPQSLQLNLSHSPHPSIDLSFTSRPAYDLPPIEHSPWTESSLDQPYQKSKKSHSSVKMR